MGMRGERSEESLLCDEMVELRVHERVLANRLPSSLDVCMRTMSIHGEVQMKRHVRRLQASMLWFVAALDDFNKMIFNAQMNAS